MTRAAYRVALVVLILFGVYLRSRRYWLNPVGLWMDEASWAIRLRQAPITRLEFRPIGYMALTKAIVQWYSDERTFRLLSYLPGVASLLVMADLSRRLFRSRGVRLLSVAIVAVNPLLIDMAREFKPYSLEFCLHLGLVWLFVRWQEKRSRVSLGALLASAALAFPFAYNVVFLLPALFAPLGYTFLRTRSYRALFATVGAALGALALMADIYFAALRGTTEDRGGTEQFWGNKYDVFYLPAENPKSPRTARLAWLAHKYGDLTAFPGSHGNQPLENPPPLAAACRKLGDASRFVWLVFHGLGLLALLKYRRQWSVLFVVPLLVCIAFNAISLWPFGAFRTNVFLFAYVMLIPLIGLDVLLERPVFLARLVGAIGSASILVTNASAVLEPHSRKQFFSHQSESTALLARMSSIRGRQPSAFRENPTVVLLDRYSCSPFRFESRFSDSAARKFGALLRSGLQFRCVRSVPAMREALRHSRDQRFFVVVSEPRVLPEYSEMLRTRSKVIAHDNFYRTQDLYFVAAR